MDHPAKRLKISRPDSRSLRDAGSRMSEGLLTSEHGSNNKDAAQIPIPTRTLSFEDLQSRQLFQKYSQHQRGALFRRNAAALLLPRAPDTTVTASVIDVNIAVGTTTIDATEVAVATDATIVSLSSYGSLTVPGLSTTNSASTGSSATDSSQATITSSAASTSAYDISSTSSSTDTLAPAVSVLLSALTTNGTTSTGSDSTTVTVTTTSTFEVSYVNGTFALSAPFALATITNSQSSNSHSSGISSSSQTSSYPLFPNASAFSTSSAAALTYQPGAGAAATGSASGSAASSSSTSGSGSGSNGPGLTPTQQQVVGGVVGGVAGIAIVLLVALVFLRWYRRRLKSQGRLPEQAGQRQISSSGGGSVHPMSERSSTVPLVAAMAGFGRRLRPFSSNTMASTTSGATTSTIPESERGFQRVAGRKIAPVLSAGGDGYGGNFGAFEKDAPLSSPSSSSYDPSTARSLATSSFYREGSGGFYSAKGSSPSPIPPSTSSPTGHSHGPSNTKDFAADSSNVTAYKPEGFAVLRPSPARTPMTQSPVGSAVKLPVQQGPILEPGAPPTPALPRHLTKDAIGRSLASHDGSQVSRASGTGSRFSERM